MVYAFFEQYSLEFWLGLLIGIVATGLYSFDAFRKPSESESPERPETKFPPNELTSESEYLKSFIIYFFGLEIVYVLFCFLGPEVVSGGVLNPAEANASVIDKDTFPLWVALVMIGILPRIPVLSFMEESWRKLMHRRAMIPKGVQRVARELNGSHFSFDAEFRQKVREKNGLFAQLVTRDDFDDEPESVEHRWARLAALAVRLPTLNAEQNAMNVIDTGFLENHRDYTRGIALECRELFTKVRDEIDAALESLKAERQREANDEQDRDGDARPRAREQRQVRSRVLEAHSEEISTLLNKIYVFLACTVVRRPAGVRIENSKTFLGFQGSALPPEDEDEDVVFGTVVGIFITGFMVAAILPYVSRLLPASMGGRAGRPSSPGIRVRLSFLRSTPSPSTARRSSSRHRTAREPSMQANGWTSAPSS